MIQYKYLFYLYYIIFPMELPTPITEQDIVQNLRIQEDIMNEQYQDHDQALDNIINEELYEAHIDEALDNINNLLDNINVEIEQRTQEQDSNPVDYNLHSPPTLGIPNPTLVNSQNNKNIPYSEKIESLILVDTPYNTTECQICYEELGNVNQMTLRCGHKFCTDCFLHTFQCVTGTSCPFCKQQIAIKIKNSSIRTPTSNSDNFVFDTNTVTTRNLRSRHNYANRSWVSPTSYPSTLNNYFNENDDFTPHPVDEPLPPPEPEINSDDDWDVDTPSTNENSVTDNPFPFRSETINLFSIYNEAASHVENNHNPIDRHGLDLLADTAIRTAELGIQESPADDDMWRDITMYEANN